MFVGIETNRLHMHVGALLIFETGPLRKPEGGVDFERLSKYLGQAMSSLPNYHRRLAPSSLFRHPIWVDDHNFHTRFHIRHTALPSPGDERVLKRLAGRIFSQPLARDRPLWELWVVEGLEEGRFALIAKVHHAMIDGVGGIEVLAALLRMTTKADFSHSARNWTPQPPPTTRNLLWDEFKYRTSGIRTMARQGVKELRALRDGESSNARSTASGIVNFLSSTLKPTPDTSINPKQVSSGRRFEVCRFTLTDFKEVKRALGGKINDVVLAVCAGALRRYLARRGDAVDTLEGFRAMMPMSLHPDKKTGHGGNLIAVSMLALPLHHSDPLVRYKEILSTTTTAKVDSHQSEGVALLERFADVTADAIMRDSVRLAGALRPYNVVITNIPGPPIPLYLLGAKLIEMFPLVPLFHQQGLGIAVVSYNGTIRFGLGADWQALPDLHLLAEDFGHALNELQELVRSQSSESLL